jgi:uncharacterized membrane protein
MKLMRLITTIIFVATAYLIITSCSKDKADNVKPTINLISPSDHDQFHPGETISFEANFSDDTELSQFKIDIHFNDGHEHKSIAGVKQEWDYEHIGELSGKTQNIQMEIEIPEDAAHGEYHFMVFCTDKAGNESFVAIEIEIEDEHDK